MNRDMNDKLHAKTNILRLKEHTSYLLINTSTLNQHSEKGTSHNIL